MIHFLVAIHYSTHKFHKVLDLVHREMYNKSQTIAVVTDPLIPAPLSFRPRPKLKFRINVLSTQFRDNEKQKSKL